MLDARFSLAVRAALWFRAGRIRPGPGMKEEMDEDETRVSELSSALDDVLVGQDIRACLSQR